MYMVVAARLARNAEGGADSSKRTGEGAGVVTALGVGKSRASGEATTRSKVNLTSSEVSSRPLTGGLLWKCTPFRSVTTWVAGLGCVWAAARSGTISPPGPYLKSRLWV